MNAPLPNVGPEAQWRARLIRYLVWYLEGTLSVLDEEDREVLQQLMETPPEDIPPEEIVRQEFVDLAAFLWHINEHQWALAHAMVEERKRAHE